MVPFSFLAMNNLVLVGLPGSGKTTLGRALARRCGKPFFDADQEIERTTGVRIPVIFDVEGEVGFRRREAATIRDLLGRQGVIIATGGGAVLDSSSRELMKKFAWVVYLDVPTKHLLERTRGDANRPLLQVADPAARLDELRTQRDPFYREVADFILDGSRYHSSSAVNRILKEWEKQSASST